MAAGAHHAEFEDDDISALTTILEGEMRGHRQKRTLCLAMFCVSLLSLVVGLMLGAWQIATELLPGRSGVELDDGMQALQLLAPLAGFAMGFFTAWWSCQHCINSIERTLFAARAGRSKLFKVFVDQISCANEKKKKAWREIAEGFV